MNEILPAWVECESVGSAADPLGLQHITDWFSDQLLPGISVTASKARYFSFLCWAYDKYKGDTKKINAWQPIIAKQEKKRQDNKIEGRYSNIIGIREGSITKATLTGSYCQTMVNIGLLEDDKKSLTNRNGVNLLKAYKYRRQTPVSTNGIFFSGKQLSVNLPKNETIILTKLLGMDKRIKVTCELEKRKQTWNLLEKYKNWEEVQLKYVNRQQKPHNTHEAMFWYAVIWGALVEYLESRFLAIHTKEKIKRTGCKFADILQNHISCLDEAPNDLELLIKIAQKKRNISEAIYSRHCDITTGNPWINRKGKSLAGSPRLDKRAATPSFRIPVFYSLAHDLGVGE